MWADLQQCLTFSHHTLFEEFARENSHHCPAWHPPLVLVRKIFIGNIRNCFWSLLKSQSVQDYSQPFSSTTFLCNMSYLVHSVATWISPGSCVFAGGSIDWHLGHSLSTVWTASFAISGYNVLFWQPDTMFSQLPCDAGTATFSCPRALSSIRKLCTLCFSSSFTLFGWEHRLCSSTKAQKLHVNSVQIRLLNSFSIPNLHRIRISAVPFARTFFFCNHWIFPAHNSVRIGAVLHVFYSPFQSQIDALYPGIQLCHVNIVLIILLSQLGRVFKYDAVNFYTKTHSNTAFITTNYSFCWLPDMPLPSNWSPSSHLF